MNIPKDQIKDFKDIDKMFTRKQQNMFIMISLIIFLSGSFYLGTVVGSQDSECEKAYYELLSEYHEYRIDGGLIIDLNRSDLVVIEEVQQNDEKERKNLE